MPSVSVGSEARYRGRDVMLLALTLAAGHVDAIGYLALGGVFTANMTGNTVLLGLHVSQEQGAAVLRSLVALGGFGAGLLIGALVVEKRREGGPWPPRGHPGARTGGGHPGRLCRRLRAHGTGP